MSRSKRLLGPLTRPRSLGPPEGGSSAPQIHLLQTLVFLFLLLDVLAYYLGVSSYCGYEISPRPEVLAYEVSLLLPYTRAKWIALFPLINPITCDTACFGGIEINMCT